MTDNENNKRIAKNSIFLYVRMFLTMIVSLYTSRIVLITLGIEDFGTYSIVAGIVTIFSFFNSAMTSSTQRYLAYYIGKNDLIKLKQTFNSTLNIHIIISLIVLLLAETIGLWFVNYKLQIPKDRIFAIGWVYQLSVFTFILGVIQVPYDALIVAREKMKIYAYMSFIEVILKLGLVYLIIIFPYDKLIIYSVLLSILAFVIRMGHRYYCKVKFEESKYEFYYDKKTYKELIFYSSWTLVGNIAMISRNQGANVILNLIFGTLLNATFAITLQIQNVVQSFVSNFQIAVNPQIIKYYAKGENENFLNLIYQSSKFSYFLVFIITLPIIYNIDYLLLIWLKEPPLYTSGFVVLCLINLLIDCISGPLMIGAQANGNIKWYQIIVGTIILLNLPISYIIILYYKNPIIIFYTSITISIFSLFVRLLFLKNMISLSINLFLRKVIYPIATITLSSIISVNILMYFINSSIIDNFFFRSAILLILIIISIIIFGLSKTEYYFIKAFFKNLIFQKKKTLFNKKY